MAGPGRLLASFGAAALVVVVGACGSDPAPEPLDLGRAEQAIRARAEETFGGDAVVGRVRCPGKVYVERGVSFGCTVVVDDLSVPVIVRQVDDAGQTRVDLAASVLLTEKVEQFVADYAAENDDPVRSVDCGDARYLVRARATTVECEVVRADGSTIPAVVGVRDAKGNTALISYGPTKPDAPG